MLGLDFFWVFYGQKAHIYHYMTLYTWSNQPLLFWVVTTITFTADIVDNGNNKNATQP